MVELHEGVWIVFDGPDGSGKSTVCKKVVERVESKIPLENGKPLYEVIHTFEPTNGPIGTKIRRQAQRTNLKIDPNILAEQFVDDRYDHMVHKVVPCIRAGGVVLQDRGMYSTFAYQGVAGMTYRRLKALHRNMQINPDVVLLFDIDIEEAFRRIDSRGEARTSFEKRDFLEQVNVAYKALPSEFKKIGINHQFHIIDANQSIDQVVDDCWAVVEPLIRKDRLY